LAVSSSTRNISKGTTPQALQNTSNLKRVYDTIICTCGVADAIQNFKKREPVMQPPLARWQPDPSTGDKLGKIADDFFNQQS
jgi:hypothetical protein